MIIVALWFVGDCITHMLITDKLCSMHLSDIYIPELAPLACIGVAAWDMLQNASTLFQSCSIAVIQ